MELSRQDPNADGDVEQTGSIIWNYCKFNGVNSTQGGATNITCTVCETTFAECSSSRAFAHILGWAVLRQKRLNIGPCAPKRKDDENGYAQFKNVQKILHKEKMAKELLLSSSQSKQSVLDLTTLGK